MSLIRCIADRITEKGREALREWETGSKRTTILVTGKTGTGKSTLVNAFIGKELATVGHGLDPLTSKVRCYEQRMGEVLVRVWDSPGLQDQTDKEDEYRRNIKENCSESDIDLMIYCIQMSTTRLSSSDINAMIKLTNTLGPSIWINSIIVLTFANEVLRLAKFEYDAEDEVPRFFTDKLHEWRESIVQFIQSELKFPAIFAKEISVMPAGLIHKPKLPDLDSVTGESYWLTELWLKALYKTKINAQPAMIKINTHRMTVKPNEYEGSAKSKEQFLDDMPLVFSEKGAEMGSKFGPAGKYCGAAIGFSYGVSKSLFLFLKLAIKGNKISEDLPEPM